MRRGWIAVALMGAACQENTLKEISDADGQHHGLLETDPDALFFGDLDVSDSLTEIVTVSSVGDVPVTLLGAAISGGGAFTMTWSPSGTVLDPGASVEVPITYFPTSIDDGGELIIQSDALNPTIEVPLSGAMLAPAIVVTPSPAVFEADDSSLVTVDLLIENVGTAPLDLTREFIRDSGHFSIVSSPIPSTVEVGEAAVMTLGYAPDGDLIDDSGELWIESSAPSSPTLVPLIGTQPPPCIGLSEAWGRGMLDLYSLSGSQITVENISEDYDICIDRWYVYMGVETQDAIGGDPYYDPGADYPMGTITLAPGEDVDFSYAQSAVPAWWCIEQTQITAQTYNFTFIGARAPEPLLSRALAGGFDPQQEIWDYQVDNPVVIVGRNVHYAELIRASADERSVGAELTLLNIGEKDVNTTVYETIPDGFIAAGFSQEPTSTVSNADGSTTYGFAVSLDGRIIDEDINVHTIYDDVDITYTLTLDDPEACIGRLHTPAPYADWVDSAGTAYTSTGSPMSIACQ